MRIELDGKLEPPRWPDGVAVRSFEPGFEGEHFPLQARIAHRQNLDGEQAGVAAAPDGDSRHRNAAGHLDDGEQRIESPQGLAFDGHADDGQRRRGGCDAWQMSGAAGAGDDRLEAAARSRAGILMQPLRRAMGRDDAALAGDAEHVEDFGGMPHRLPVGLAAHDDADRRGGVGHVAPFRCG